MKRQLTSLKFSNVGFILGGLHRRFKKLFLQFFSIVLGAKTVVVWSCKVTIFLYFLGVMSM